MLKIVLGSTRQAKVEALRNALRRIADVDETWRSVEVLTREVETSAPAMPLTDEELMLGARLRAEAVQHRLLEEAEEVEFGGRYYVGLEGGFHSITVDDRRETFLRGWAYVTDGERGYYGSGPSVVVPEAIFKRVIDENRELGIVIDEVAGERDVRSRQGAWGLFSRELLTRAMSFESALIAAFAPFYNASMYAEDYQGSNKDDRRAECIWE
ncbi:MAG: inosine/xanthosine triphosphatase [Pyrinomonadaceae bacterium]